MAQGTDGPVTRAKRQFMADYTADPWVKFVLALALLLCGFYFWHRIPGFATIDERWRLIDVMKAIGIFAKNPSLAAIRRAVLAERVAGATLYLYGIALVPVFVIVAATGHLSAFATVGPRFYPTWVWTWSLVLARFVVVVTAVGCVYLTYRIGVQIRDRTTGRFAAILLTLTFGFLFMAHEVGEDVPALFCVLLVVSLALQYVKTGDETIFLIGCLVGGFAIGFKFTAGASVVVLGAAYLLRARTKGWPHSLFRPRLVGLGMVFGVAAVIVGYPEVLVAGPDVLQNRILEQTANKNHGIGGPAAPVWWWMLRNYLSGLGLGLFIASVCGIAASVARLRERSFEADATALLLVTIITYLLAYSRWEYVRIHHLLPTFPLLAIVVAIWFSRLHATDHSLARPLIALVLITSGAYAVVGDLQYAVSPRDEAAAWLHTHAPDNATMEVYRMRYRDAVFPRNMKISSYQGRGSKTAWMLAMPSRCPDYIQLTYWDLTYLGARGPNQARTVPWVATRGGPEPRWMPPFSAPRRAEYVHDLLRGKYPYTVVAEFGPRPPKWPHPRFQTSFVDLLRTGVTPWSVTYGDDQDLRTEQYTLILQRTGSCTPNRGSQPVQDHLETTTDWELPEVG